MKVTVVTIGVKRDVRHEPYNVSQCRVELTGHMEEGDDLELVYKELHEDAVIIVEEMVIKEKRDFRRRLISENKNQQ